MARGIPSANVFGSIPVTRRPACAPAVQAPGVEGIPNTGKRFYAKCHIRNEVEATAQTAPSAAGAHRTPEPRLRAPSAALTGVVGKVYIGPSLDTYAKAATCSLGRPAIR